MLRMNVSLMEYMRAEYDNLSSRIEASETRISKELLEKAEEQAREASRMDGSQLIRRVFLHELFMNMFKLFELVHEQFMNKFKFLSGIFE